MDLFSLSVVIEIIVAINLGKNLELTKLEHLSKTHCPYLGKNQGLLTI